MEPAVIPELPSQMLVLLAIALLISASGFFRLVYFVSLGYAFSISAMAIATFLIFFPLQEMVTLAYLAFLFLYGLRLGIYLVSREYSPSYRRELQEIQDRNFKVGALKRVLIWVGVAILYVCMFSPAFYRTFSVQQIGKSQVAWIALAGLIVMGLGLGLESLADWQKAAYKEKNPKRFCDAGVYRWVRCPNYLGEILFWTGSLLAGAGTLTHWVPWLLSGIGYVCIVLIMMGSTKRLENKQDERYGENPEYQRYVRTVPVLFPFLPVYTLKGVRVYLE